MSTPIAKFELPLPPGINQSYQPVMIRGKTGFISKAEHKQFKKDAVYLLKNQVQLLNNQDRDDYQRNITNLQQNNSFLYLEIFFFIEDILKRDEDGGLKVVQDSVCKHLGIDDKYVIDAHIGKRLAKGKPRCEVSVYLFEGEIA